MSSSKIMHKLATDSKAMMEFKTRGRLPRMRDPLKTPLWELLNKIPVRDRMAMELVTLSPKLGYNIKSDFRNAEMLFQWLGGRSQMLSTSTLPLL